MLTPYSRCRRCGRVSYKRGPCPTCRVFAEYGPTDRIECVPHGQTAELRRTRKERDEYRRLFQASRFEETQLRERVLRMERVKSRLGQWSLAMLRARDGMR